MLFPQASPLLKRSLEVTSKGENVILTIGNVDLPMHYEHAFDLSAWIREEAAFIKSGTGLGRVTRSLGMLHDDSAKAKPLPHQPGTAIHVKPKLREYRRSDVSSQGRMVLVLIGTNTVSLHFQDALKIAQWLRVRAKEARNTAGDTRHWSEIGSVDEGGE